MQWRYDLEYYQTEYWYKLGGGRELDNQKPH